MVCHMPYPMVRNQKLMVVVRIWPRARPFDLLSRFVRDFDIRQMSPYDFLDSSNHSASNDMRQAHVLMYGLRDRVPNSYLTTSPPMRGYITNFPPHLRCLPPLNSNHRVHTTHFKWNLALHMNCITRVVGGTLQPRDSKEYYQRPNVTVS